MIYVKAGLYRHEWHIRIRGIDPASGEKRDQREKIKPEVFAAAGVSPSSKRATHAAEAHAAAEERRLNDPELLRRRMVPRGRMDLAGIWRLYVRKNPEQVGAETLRRSGKMARAVLRCRCRAVDDVVCLGHMDPRKIDLGAAEEFRNDRAKECAVCALRENVHPNIEGKHTFRGMAPRSIFNELGWLKQQLVFARDREAETGIDSIALQRLPKVIGKRGRGDKLTPSSEQFFAVLDACQELGDEGERYRRLLGFAFSTGIRKNPLSHFRTEWYDRVTRRIFIPAEFMKGKGDRYEALSVPICRWAASFLDGLPASGYAWPNPATGRPQVDFFRVERVLSVHAKLPKKFSLHRLRAGFNTLLITHRCARHTTEVPFFIRELLMGHSLGSQILTYADFSKVMVEAVAVIDCAFDEHEKQSGVTNIASRRLGA